MLDVKKVKIGSLVRHRTGQFWLIVDFEGIHCRGAFVTRDKGISLPFDPGVVVNINTIEAPAHWEFIA